MKKICVVCGKEFESKGRTTCSEECRQLARKKSMAIVYENKKKQNPNTYKAGKYTRTCIICGETFRTNSKTREVCYIPHTRKCCICGKEFPLNVYSSKTLTCSSGCASDLRVQRNMEKYGVRSNFQLESNKEKIKQTCLEKYGVENPMQSEEVKEKLKASNQEKYGVDWVVQAEEVKAKSKATNLERYGVEYGSVSEQANEKRKKTNQERYGVDHVFQSREFQENAKQSNLERYGTEYYFQSDNFREKAIKTWMEHYGVDNPLKSPEIQHRTEVTSMEKYGTRKPQQSDIVKSKIIGTQIQTRADTIENESAKNEYLKFKRNPGKYVREALENKLTPTTIAKKIGYSDNTTILNVIHEYDLEDLTKFMLPQMEQDITLFLEDTVPGIVIEHHNRKIISPLELDLYLPEYNLAIECNPTATHNSTISFHELTGTGSDVKLSKNYHQHKSEECEKQGIFLFHVFGHEWTAKPNIIKSMLLNLIHSNRFKYFGRNLYIKEATYAESYQFLSANHRQGFAASKINLGLYTSDDELVSLMTFGRSRNTLGRRKSDTDVWELIRFCSKLNTSVVGGASKLFKYFIENYRFSKIISFSDKAHTRGALYEILGFTNVGISNPNYVWVNIVTDLYFTRVTCQKQNLSKLFNEPALDIKNQTEEQIMVSHGFVQVFDSGTVRWEYTK